MESQAIYPLIMDDYADYLYLQSQVVEEENNQQDYQDALLALSAAMIVVGGNQTNELRAARRSETRQYLCRDQLLPDPRQNTPWQALYHSRNDRAFITTMGLDVKTFDHVLNSGFASCWNQTPVHRNDTDPDGAPRPGRRSLDAAGGLGLILHYLSSTMTEISLQEIFAIVPSTVS